MAGTPVGSNAHILEVLDRNNYEHWRSRLETYLLAEDLWEVVEATEEPPTEEDDQAEYKAWTKKNAKALYAIQNSCGKELFCFISKIKTAKGAWEALEQECKVVQEYDENNADHLVRFESFIESVISGDWDKAKKCLGEVDVRSVTSVEVKAVYRWWEGTTTLHVAAWAGHAQIVKELVHLMTQEDLKTKNINGHTALHLAAEKGHVHVVRELPVLLMGEVKDEDGDTALHNAVHEGKVDVVKELVLLMRQEDLQIKNDAGYTAFHLAVNKGNMPMVKEFVTKERGENNIGKADFEPYIPFTTYVEEGDWDKANECLRELDDPCAAVTAVDPTDWYGDTALHVAAREGHLNVIKGLVSLLKTRQEDDLELKTAGDFITFGSGVSEELLMERAKYMVEQYEKTVGYCLDVQNVRGHTALLLAVREENVDMVRELAPVMRKEGLEIKDDDGDTPLHYAVSHGKLDIAKELAQSMRQEGLEMKNNKGSNALHLAVTEEHIEIVKELIPLMRPEALKEKDGDGVTSLSWVIQCFKDEDVCEIAKIMGERSDQVFGAPTAPNNDIPVVNALRWNKWKSARFIYSVTPSEFLQGPHGVALICYSLNARRHIDLAWDLLQRYPVRRMTGDERAEIMLILSSMNPAFLSGSQLTPWRRWLHDPIHAQEAAQMKPHEVSINIAESEYDGDKNRDIISSGVDVQEAARMDPYNLHEVSTNIVGSEYDDDKNRDFISWVPNLFRRIARGLHKCCVSNANFGTQDMYKQKTLHQLIFYVLRCIGEATKDYITEDELKNVKSSIFSAIQQGNYEFVTHIFKGNPALLDRLNRQAGKGMFHLAIENRQKEVFSLIYKLKEKDRHAIGLQLVNKDNNLLHYAANLSSLPQFDHILDASLQMQRELQWFKEVERVVPSEMYEHRNRSENMTARELFTKNHKKLMDDAEESIKRTSTSCTVVGALIVTVMFAAAFTVPGGNNDNTGLPLFRHHKLFNGFIISDTISLVSSTSSVITFLGILTSRYAEDDFLKSLPKKMMFGLITLFFSIANMMIAFSCALIIMLERKWWIIALSALLTSVPVILFVLLLFPLLIKTLKSTYGFGAFGKKKTVKL